MIRFIASIIAILALFSACSKTGNPTLPFSRELPVSPSAQDESINAPSAGIQAGDYGAGVLAAVKITLNPSTGEAFMDGRSAQVELRHYRVSYFLTPPKCDTCISIQKYTADPTLGTADVVISVLNPTPVYAYDVRGLVRVPAGHNLRLLNADGYTSLFPMSGYQTDAPFRIFSRYSENHAFEPSGLHSEEFNLKTLPGADPTDFTFLVTAAYPSLAGDVSSIAEFRQSGKLFSGGGSADVSFLVTDLQSDITDVVLHAELLGAGDVWLAEQLDGRWGGHLTNPTAVPGLYDLKVEAHSPNSQNAVTSHFYRAVVFCDMESFRSQLLSLVNSDRADNGKSSLATDPLLDTVAQSHAQDMADKDYFSHTNLDGWLPWNRMDYYGIQYQSAGENIAVGQDTPQQVENDWMNSSGHRANILSGAYNKIGLGIAPCPAGAVYAPGYYWVQLFSN
jgi:uncharacterized protein YkwD